MSNHVRLLLQTGDEPMAAFMRRLPKGTVFAHGRTAMISRARSLFCYWVVKELGAKPVELAREFDQTPPAITVAVRRVERLAEENEYVFNESELFNY